MDELKVLLPALGMVAYCLALGMIFWILAAFLGRKLKFWKLITTSIRKLKLLLDSLVRR
jgi:cytochrome c biogenesis protein CcdA